MAKAMPSVEEFEKIIRGVLHPKAKEVCSCCMEKAVRQRRYWLSKLTITATWEGVNDGMT